MIKIFIKDQQIRSFNVEGNKIFTTIILGDFKITNPTLEQFESVGWKKYEQPEIEPIPYVPTIEELVEQKIRERYSLNQEFEVQRKRDVETEAFTEYYNFVEECIREAKEELGKR